MIKIDSAPKLADLTTIHLGGPCVARISFSADEAEKLPDLLLKTGGRPTPFGGGSNILALGGEKNNTLLCTVKTADPEVYGSRADGCTLVQIDAGMRLGALLTWCAKRGFSGLETLVGIPGTVGGAVAGNAGSFGADLGTVLHQVTFFDSDQGIVRYTREECSCGYRHFSLKNQEDQKSDLTFCRWRIILEVILAFTHAESAVIHQTMHDTLDRKLQTQPVKAQSAGCVFKNPAGDSAGRLLELAGFRGRAIGGMSFSERHANFLVNDGNGKAEQAQELILRATESVWLRNGILLEPEVQLWDC